MKKEQERLNKYIASSGFCSRRKADELIASGSVYVNGAKISELGALIFPGRDKVVISGKLIKPEKHIYIKFYKPAGYITTMSDEKGRKTIYSLLPDELHALKPAGRLDKDSSGLLILSNDGDFINELMHPSLKTPKTYRVSAQGKLNNNDLIQMEKGIVLDEGKTAFALAQIIEYENKNTVLEMVLCQGLNRQIRKMLDKLGHPVISLKRLSIGPVNLDGLKRGQFKYLKPKQIKEIRNYLKNLNRDESIESISL